MKKFLRASAFVVSVISLLWFMLPIYTGRILNIGNMTGISVFALLSVYFMFMDKVNECIKKLWQKQIGKVLLSFAAAVGSCIMLTALVLTSFMVSSALDAPKDNSSTLIVLGCRVYEERASLMLVERLDAAYAYLSENEEAVCIVSGGQGDGENISEAECMYRYLVKKGIDESRIHKEDKSTSTRENLLFSLEIIKREGLNQNIAIATNEFHLLRANLIAKQLDLNSSSVHAITAWWLFPTYFVRELYGILYQLVF